MMSDPVGTLALLKLGEADADLSYALDAGEILLGRDPASDIVLRSRTVSRRHARIVRRDQGYWIEDLRSTGGTWLNGLRIDRPARLRDGDRIRLGDCLLGFSAAAAAAPEWDASEATILGERETTGTAERERIDVRAEEKLSAILDIGRALSGALDLQEVLDRILQTLFRIFPQARRGFVLMRGEHDPEPRPRAMLVRGDAPRDFAFSRTVFDHVVGRGKAVLCTDVRDDARFAGIVSLDEAEVRTMICVPLRDHHNRPVGLLQLDTGGPGDRFRDEDLDLLAAVAGPVGVAIDNARLLHEAGRRQRRLEFLAEVGAVLSSSLQREAMLGGLARLVVPYLADLCLIDLIAEDGSARRAAARHAEPSRQPLADALLRPGAALAAERCWWARVVTPPRPGAAEAAEVDEATLGALFPTPEQRAVAERLKVRSHLGIPLAVHGRVLGVLSLIGLGAPRRYDPADRALAEEVAVRTALALDHARMLQVARDARREAESANRAKDRFLAVLSHELRTPLTPALVTVSSLLDGELDPRLRALLTMVRRNIELEARLIDDLLDLTRISRGALRIDRRPIDAHHVIRLAIEVCREAVEQGRQRLEVDLRAGDHRVEGDPDRLQQVIWNLLQNAVRFTPPGGVIALASRNAPAGDDGKSLVVEVRDSGVGIEADRLERIFEPFHQGDAPPRLRGRGLGLGLAISRSLAEAHGGSLTAASDGPGRGATFTLVLPALVAGAAEPPPSPAPPAAEAPEPLEILLVEDNRDTLASLARALRALGHRVRTASDCRAAREAIRGRAPDLLLSDIELPDGSGLDLMREVARAAAVPGIAMSGYGTEHDLRLSAEAGFAEHLIKPVTIAGVDRAIRRVLPARGRSAPAAGPASPSPAPPMA